MPSDDGESDRPFATSPAMRFRAEARRNRLVGLWAAGMLGLAGEEAEAYARAVILADFEEAGDADVLRKLAADFAERGVEIAEQDLRARMDALLEEAKQQLIAERR